ncbi:MAG: beta-ketoacyl-ACP synthase 3 [Chlamydiales bacterium]|nr:beta-ketoacyl-ACP synthase 3 [Chlamydiia bacterium]MCP5504001.1 beta-ketoacyl-ACP synthase 3 [Chlamydiales bacterium]
MSRKNVKILGTGCYLPKKQITAEDLEKKLGLKPGTIMDGCGVRMRYYIEDETVSEMGVHAAKEAIKNAGIEPSEINGVIGASSAPEQAIPSTAALIHKKLGLSQATTFDVNSTCLSFLTALDFASFLLEEGRHKYLLIVSSEIASKGLNAQDLKTAALFGDGAGAAVIGRDEKGKSRILSSKFETWSENQEACLLEGGGSKFYNGLDSEKKYFQMNGPKLYRSIAPRIEAFFEEVLSQGGINREQLDLMIPHQASPFGLRLMAKRIGISAELLVDIVEDYGNMIAASIPLALHLSVMQGRLKRGDRALMIGTSAGLSIGGMLIEY